LHIDSGTIQRLVVSSLTFAINVHIPGNIFGIALLLLEREPEWHDGEIVIVYAPQAQPTM